MLHLQHRNQQFLRKWPSTAMWFDTNLAFRRLDTTMADQCPSLSHFLNFVEFAVANFDCKIRIYLNCNVNNMRFIVYSHYKTHRFVILKNINKNPPNLRILRCREHAPSSEYCWIRHCMRFYILFWYYYRFDIAANTTSLGIFLYICIICRYMYFYKQWTDRLYCDCMTHTGAS